MNELDELRVSLANDVFASLDRALTRTSMIGVKDAVIDGIDEWFNAHPGIRVRAKMVELLTPEEVLRRMDDLRDIVEVAFSQQAAESKDKERCGNCNRIRQEVGFGALLFCKEGNRNDRTYVKASDHCVDHWPESLWILCHQIGPVDLAGR